MLQNLQTPKEQVDLTFIEVGGEEEENAKRRARRTEGASGPRKKTFEDDASRNRARRPMSRPVKKAGQE